MESLHSFLQTVFQFVKSLFVNVSKRMHRNAVVLTTGVAVVTVVTFTAGDFRGGGKSALVAFAETPQTTDGTEALLEEEQTAGELEDLQVIAEAVSREPAESESKEPETEGTYETQNTVETEETPDRKESETAEDVPEKEPAEQAAGEIQKDGTGTEKTPDKSEKEKETQSTGPGGTEGVPAQTGLKEIAENEDTETEAQEAATVFACSSSDYRVLLKIVQAEAGICDTKGRILVANVILNRVRSDEFPDTIPGVVYEKYQFSPVIDGSIDSCKVTQETIDAVDRALAGEDYSQGALYFMNRRTSSKKNVRWFDSRLEYLFKHGDHEFFK